MITFSFLSKEMYKTVDQMSWKRAKSIAYFSDLKINKTEDLEYTYTVKHLYQLFNDYRTCSSFIKKESEDLTIDKKEYIDAIDEIKEIVNDNISSNEDRDLWLNLKQILERTYEVSQKNPDANNNEQEEKKSDEK